MMPESDDVDLKKSMSIIWNHANKDRYTHIGRFKFDHWIFSITMFLIFGYLFFVAYSYNFQLDHYECGAPVGKQCKNPFYEPTTWKNLRYLEPGVYGAQLGPFFYSAEYVPILLIGIAFLLNHLIYNKKKKAPRTPQKEKKEIADIDDEEEP